MRGLGVQVGRSGIQGGQQVCSGARLVLLSITGNSDSTLVSHCHQPTESAQPPGKEDGAVFAGDVKH